MSSPRKPQDHRRPRKPPARSQPQLTKVQIAAEFTIPDGEYQLAGTYGPVQLTPREWASFDLARALEDALNDAQQP